MNSERSHIYFNETSLQSDLTGGFQGAVLFAQTSVIPSRASALPGDTQPRLVGLRDTLVMLKPLSTNIDIGRGITMRVRLNGESVFETRLQPPEEMPRITGQIDVTESELADPGQYDRVIDTQELIWQIANDPDAHGLRYMFSQRRTIKISLADAQWAELFYLPRLSPVDDPRKIVFHSTAGYGSQVCFDGRCWPVNRGDTLVLLHKQGRWLGLEDVHFSRIRYGVGFWSGVIPWEHMQAGFNLEFEAGDAVAASQPYDVGAPTEVVLNTIDIGMLTPNRQVFTPHFDAARRREYFQHVPCSRLIVNQYEPVHWERITMPDGTVYTESSSDEGDSHNGDLRQRIGKELISLGINNAAYGIHSSPGLGEDGLNKHFISALCTAHSSIGKYANGDVIHGYSGGGSIVTLDSYKGNEFSHELGHNYNLGHYPGGFDGCVHRPADAVNSAWGWDSDRNSFLPNFEKTQSGQSTCYENQCQAPFHEHSFGADTMGGGYPMLPEFNKYTLHTPYVNRLIQQNLEAKVVFDPNSSTGYTKWDEGKKAMQEWAESHRAHHTEFDAANMARLMASHRLVEAVIDDTNWAISIHVPAANSANNGKGFYVVNNGQRVSTLSINGTQIPLLVGTSFKYQSNGSQWQPVEEFSFQVARKPEQQGVPIITLLGYYDPQNQLEGRFYPPLHAAYGNTFQADRLTETQALGCYLEVRNLRDERLYFLLRTQRLHPSVMNRFHVNVPRSFETFTAIIRLDRKVILMSDITPPTGSAQYSIHGRS